jgi:hypothetical protein
MLGSILVLFLMPVLDTSRVRSSAFRPLFKLSFWFLVVDFFILMWLGGNHPEAPYVLIGQFATAFYFSWFLVIVPIIGIIENTLQDIATDSSTGSSSSTYSSSKISPPRYAQGAVSRSYSTAPPRFWYCKTVPKTQA